MWNHKKATGQIWEYLEMHMPYSNRRAHIQVVCSIQCQGAQENYEQRETNWLSTSRHTAQSPANKIVCSMINSSLKKPFQINSNKTSIYIYWVGWSLHLEQFIARLWIDCSLTIQTPSRHFVHMPRQPPFLTSAVFFVRRGVNRLVAPRRNVGPHKSAIVEVAFWGRQGLLWYRQRCFASPRC